MKKLKKVSWGKLNDKDQAEGPKSVTGSIELKTYQAKKGRVYGCLVDILGTSVRISVVVWAVLA